MLRDVPCIIAAKIKTAGAGARGGSVSAQLSDRVLSDQAASALATSYWRTAQESA